MTRVWFGSAALVCVLVFYWYEYRPTQIIRECIDRATNDAMAMMKDRARIDDSWRKDDYKKMAKNGFFMVADKEQKYRDCLREHGLEPNDKE